MELYWWQRLECRLCIAENQNHSPSESRKNSITFNFHKIHLVQIASICNLQLNPIQSDRLQSASLGLKLFNLKSDLSEIASAAFKSSLNFQSWTSKFEDSVKSVRLQNVSQKLWSEAISTPRSPSCSCQCIHQDSLHFLDQNVLKITKTKAHKILLL